MNAKFGALTSSPMNYALLAAFLGEPYRVSMAGPYSSRVVGISSELLGPLCSDADLVMAVLEKLHRDKGGYRMDGFTDDENRRYTTLTIYKPFKSVEAPTPIAAICALIEALEKP